MESGHARSLRQLPESVGATRRLSLRELDETLLIAFPADQDCKSARCYYRLLAVDGELRERFSFQGTGIVLTFTTGMHIEHFHDIFFAMAFETADRTHLAFARVGKTILVSPVPQDVFPAAKSGQILSIK